MSERIASTIPAPAARRWSFISDDDARAFSDAMDAPSLVVLMVGIPGSGKSSWIADNLPDATVCSAEAFFARRGAFSVELLSEAHESCLRDHIHHVRADTALVAVDNTNLHASEYSPYIATALAYRYRVLIVKIRADVPTAFVRNVHGVPAGVINKMARALESWQLPPHWERDSRVTVVRVLST